MKEKKVQTRELKQKKLVKIATNLWLSEGEKAESQERAAKRKKETL